ncbi:hypothetical protein URH17368_1218 [Alicyclobacillus hesperidum URH17-3-68]|nr:hypothetical protein URH17368_1218 [Alicyclobacillus hesperidum URH17-3-68]
MFSQMAMYIGTLSKSSKVKQKGIILLADTFLQQLKEV